MTWIIVCLLLALLALSCVVPTRFVIAFFVGLTFYIGNLMGRTKRANRSRFLEELSRWSSSACGRELSWRAGDMCSALEERSCTARPPDHRSDSS